MHSWISTKSPRAAAARSRASSTERVASPACSDATNSDHAAAAAPSWHVMRAHTRATSSSCRRRASCWALRASKLLTRGAFLLVPRTLAKKYALPARTRSGFGACLAAGLLAAAAPSNMQPTSACGQYQAARVASGGAGIRGGRGAGGSGAGAGEAGDDGACDDAVVGAHDSGSGSGSGR